MTNVNDASRKALSGAVVLETPTCPHCGALTRLSHIESDAVVSQGLVCVYDCMCGAALTRPYETRAD